MGYTFNVNVYRMPHCPLKEEDVVRCKDCVWRDSFGCSLYSEVLKTPEDWFCADGEKAVKQD